MKTVVVANFPIPKHFSDFMENFPNIAELKDVIFIKNPKTIEYLKEELKDRAGEFDRVLINTHGSRKDAPKMDLAGDSQIEIPDIVKLINQASPNITVRIDLSSCYIGSHFEQIEKCDPKSKYYQNLRAALKPDQLLNLHGDDRNGLIGLSFDSRLQGIVKSINYSTSEAIFDSSEALFSVRKNKDDKLESYSCPIFTKDNNSSISSENHLRYLKLASEEADKFDSKARTQNITIGHQKYAQISQNSSLLKVDFEDRLFRAFQKESEKSDEKGVKFIQRLCFDKIDLNFQSKFLGDTALFFTISKNNQETAKILIAKEADLNLKNNKGWSPLMAAASENNEQITRSLINAGVNVDLQNNYGSTALMIAISQNHQKIIQILIDAKANLNLKNKDGRTALFKAVARDDEKTTRSLINAKANLDLQNNYGQTVLMVAESKNNPEIIQNLIDAKANLNIRDSDGWTVLMMTALSNHKETAKILIAKGANVDLQNNKYGQTALMIATLKNHLETLRLLIDNKADLNLQDKDGQTALMIAVNNGNKEAIVMLIEGGAKNYSDAQNLASDIGQEDVIETLNQAIMKRAKKEEELKTPTSTAPRLNSNPSGSEPSVIEQELYNPNSSYQRYYQKNQPLSQNQPLNRNPHLRGGNLEPSSTITTNSAVICAASFIAALGLKFIVKKLANRVDETHKKK